MNVPTAFAASILAVALASGATNSDSDLRAQVASIKDQLAQAATDREVLFDALTGLRADIIGNRRAGEAIGGTPRDHADTIARLTETGNALRRILTLEGEIRQLIANDAALNDLRAKRLAIDARLGARLQVILASLLALQFIFVLLQFVGRRR